MDKQTRDILQRPFEKELIKQRKGPGGKQFAYVEIQHYLRRLNEAFGHEWSLEIVRREQYEDQVIVEVKITAGNVVKMGLGGAVILRRKDDGSMVSLADSFKIGEADAVKRAARLLGVGAELYLDPPESDAWQQDTSRTGLPFPADGESLARNGRVTTAQLNKLQELVGELGSEWSSFRQWVRETRGVNVEYASRSVASELIGDLLDRLQTHRRTRRSNGGFADTGAQQ